MLEMPPVYLPPLLIKLCSMDIHENNKSWKEVTDLISRDKAMRILCERAFKEFDSKGNLESILKSMGWKSFRARLISLFYVKVKSHKYPHVTILSEVEELIDFEKRYEDFSLRSNSRILMFAFYLMQSQFYLEKEYSQFEKNLIEFPIEIDQALTMAKNKTDELDWVLFTLWHIYESFGKERFLKEVHKAGGDYLLLYEKLEGEDKEILIKNILAYSIALDSDEMLFYKKV